MGDKVQATLSPADTHLCDRIYSTKNRTYFIYGGYEGIPENLLLNVIIWILLFIIFSLLRKKAWDYGRIALVSRTEDRWQCLFYGDNSSKDHHSSQESLDAIVNRKDKTYDADYIVNHREQEGLCSWIVAFVKLKDTDIYQKCGRDALQYLQFQRYLMVYMAIVTFICLVVILPVNYLGTLESSTQRFGRTTIINIPTNSPVLWVHAVFSVVFLILAFLMMGRFARRLEIADSEDASRTLLISNIPEDCCFRNIIQQHFSEAYPEEPVIDIQFAYNIKELVRLEEKRERALKGLIASDSILKATGERPRMVPCPFGQLCCCCGPCGCKEVDAIEYFAEKEHEYSEKCEVSKVNAYKHTLGIAFITFEDGSAAARVKSDFNVPCRGPHNPNVSSVSAQLGVHNWVVDFAPLPENIKWENLSTSDAWWWLKALGINFVVVIILFFLTTPSIVMNLINQGKYSLTIEEISNFCPVLAQFIPVFLLWLFSVLLPAIVYQSDVTLIGHWTRSAEHHAVMRKSYILLLLMVLILPSLGLTSAKALVEWFSSRNEKSYEFRWQCIFLPDNGAFFVNYVITSAFIGTATEMVRLPELFVYGFNILMAKSKQERTAIRKSALWDFQYGIKYAWMLCVFSVTMAYSIPSPLITPCALIYLGLKHVVDRYNIYFAYSKSCIDKNIHTSAINFVLVSVILLQCSILFFTILRSESMNSLTLFSTVALVVTLVLYSGQLFCGYFKKLSPIQYCKFGKMEPQNTKPFIPDILLATQVRTDFEPSVPGDTGYGATDPPNYAGHAGAQPTIVTSTGEVAIYEAR